MTFPVIFLIIINITAYLLFGYDKYCAKRDAWRIPEATLLLAALAGGAAGALLGMKMFRHKTKKPLFSIGVPLLLAAQTVFAVLYLINY